MRYRLYLFVGHERTVLLDAMAPARDDPAQTEADRMLFDRVAASIAELE